MTKVTILKLISIARAAHRKASPRSRPPNVLIFTFLSKAAVTTVMVPTPPLDVPKTATVLQIFLTKTKLPRITPARKVAMLLPLADAALPLLITFPKPRTKTVPAYEETPVRRKTMDETHPSLRPTPDTRRTA